MLCDVCHSNEAVICYTEIINGVKKEQHLCRHCAARYSGTVGRQLSGSTGGFLASLLASVLGTADTGMSQEYMQKTNYICPTCHMTYNEFLRDGKFGCQDCYKTFGLILDPYLKKIQGNMRHVGKHPKFQDVYVDVPDLTKDKRLSESEAALRNKPENISDTKKENIPSSELEMLQDKLQKAIKAEEYEEAARIRDMIRAVRAQKENERSHTAADEAVSHE